MVNADNEASNATITGLLVSAYVAAVPFVNVISPTPLIPVPMLLGVALMAWLISTGRFQLDAGYLAFLLLCTISFLPWLISGEYISGKTLTHSIGIVASVTIYYAVARNGISLFLVSHSGQQLLRIFYFSLLVTSAFTIIEFLGINGRIPDITPFIPYSQQSQFEALIFGLVRRPRGFATEPGVMALFYDLCLFLVLPLLKDGKMWKLGYFFVIVPGYLALFSTASIASVGLALAFLTLWNFRTRFIATSGRTIVFAALLAITLVAGGAQVRKVAGDQVFSRIATLVTGSGADTSASERRDRFEEVKNIVSEFPFGIGFGVAASLPDKGGKYKGVGVAAGQISLIGTFLVAGGLPAGALATAIVAFFLVRALRIPVYGPYIGAGGIAISIHQLSVTEFWLPFYWTFFALAESFHRRYRVQPVETSQISRYATS